MSSDRSSALKDMLSAISRLSAEERLLMTDIVTRALYKAEGQSDSGRTVLDLPENPGPGPKPPNHKPAWVSTRKKEVRKWALRALEVENTSPCREWGVPAAADVTLVNESNEVDNIEFIFEHGSPPPQLPNSTLPAKHYVPFRIDWDNHSPMLTKWTLKASIAFAEWLIPKIHNNEFTCWLPRNDDPIAQHWEWVDLLSSDFQVFVASKKSDRKMGVDAKAMKNREARRRGRRERLWKNREQDMIRIGLPGSVVNSFHAIGKDAMSDDDSDEENSPTQRGSNAIIPLPSRHPEITSLVRSVDEYTELSNVQRSRLFRKRALEPYLMSSETPRCIPPGLPQNTYCPEWLDRAGRFEAIKIKKKYGGRSLPLGDINAATTLVNDLIARRKSTAATDALPAGNAAK
ncbi:hypothetical protein FRC16_007143 [Serendipita sp. 398]|nr:hypothetical protein FRC16_007143 [Serendipita sp. 398]